MMFSKYK